MMTMTNIGAGAKTAEYYCQYCQEKGESQGVWMGRGAEHLHLDGDKVQQAQMEEILRGFNPDGSGEGLCFKPGDDHRGGWDVTWSPDKSVSLLWANGSSELRREIEDAQKRAVAAGVDFLQKHAAWTRTGKGGANREAADLVLASFQHSTNRAKEPHLHTHTIVFNVGRTRSDGVWRTLEARDMYRMQLTAGAIYKSEMAAQLQKLGFGIERTKDGFRVSGVDPKACEAQSSRSRAIDQALKEAGLDRDTASARAREIVALATRETKGETRREFERWREEIAEAGFTSRDVERIRGRGQDVVLSTGEAKAIQEKAVSDLTEQKSTFEPHQLIRRMAEESFGKCDSKAVYGLVAGAMKSGEILSLGERNFEKHLTTQKMFDLERELVEITKKRQGEGNHVLSERNVEGVLKAHRDRMAAEGKILNPDQESAVRRVASDGNGVSFVCGVAGAGKTSASRIVRDAFERENYTVFGIAPTNKAAQELKKDLNVETDSIHRFLAKAEKGELELSRRSIVFIDEGAMVDSRKTLLLNHVLEKAGAKVVYMGDPRQIQPIEAGQAFGTQYRMFKGVELGTVTRQSDPEEAKAILHVRDGKTKDCLSYLEKSGRLHFMDDRLQVYEKVLERWQAFREMNREATSLIVASRNRTVDTVNSEVHSRLKKGGELSDGRVFKTTKGEMEVCIGERLLFTGNLKRHGISRSQLVTATSVSEKRIEAVTDYGQKVAFDPREFKKFTYGYCLTANRSQGATVDRAFVVADGGFMDRERFYVALSRGRGGNEVFADKQMLGDLSDAEKKRISLLPENKQIEAQEEAFRGKLAQSLNRSGEKLTTQDFEVALQEKGAFKAEFARRAALDDAWASLRQGLERAEQETQKVQEKEHEREGISMKIR